MMAENETGTVMLPPAKTQEAFVHIGFAKACLLYTSVWSQR